MTSSSSKCRFLRIGNENHPHIFPLSYDNDMIESEVEFLCCVVCSWASMAKNDLRGRAANAIKNRWNHRLKKRHATISDLRRYLLYLEEHLMDDEASDHSVRGDDLEALMVEIASLIPNIDPNQTSDHSVREDDPEAWTSSPTDLSPNHHPNAIRSIMDTYTS